MVASAVVWGTRLRRLLILGAYALIMLCSVGALFAVPSPYKQKLRGHAQYAQRVVTDDATRAVMVDYMREQTALLPAVMRDIRCELAAHSLTAHI